MQKTILIVLGLIVMTSVNADSTIDKQAIKQVVLDYIESQHQPSRDKMDKALHADMRKRTYWKHKDGQEFVMETSRETMLRVAETYNKNGDRFPVKPRKEVKILDIDGRVATVKLTADDWIDYMHLMKDENGQWQIINVLWQYHNQAKHQHK